MFWARTLALSSLVWQPTRCIWLVVVSWNAQVTAGLHEHGQLHTESLVSSPIWSKCACLSQSGSYKPLLHVDCTWLYLDPIHWCQIAGHVHQWWVICSRQSWINYHADCEANGINKARAIAPSDDKLAKGSRPASNLEATLVSRSAVYGFAWDHASSQHLANDCALQRAA